MTKVWNFTSPLPGSTKSVYINHQYKQRVERNVFSIQIEREALTVTHTHDTRHLATRGLFLLQQNFQNGCSSRTKIKYNEIKGNTIPRKATKDLEPRRSYIRFHYYGCSKNLRMKQVESSSISRIKASDFFTSVYENLPLLCLVNLILLLYFHRFPFFLALNMLRCCLFCVIAVFFVEYHQQVPSGT